MEYIFRTSSYDVEALAPEVGRALEKRVELASRERLPGLWKLTDAISDGEKAGQLPRSRAVYLRVVGIAMVVIGLIMLITAFRARDEMMLCLFVGLCGVGVGCHALWSLYKKPRSPQEKRAKAFLSSIAGKEVTEVRFSEEGMQLSDDTIVPYEEVEYFIETESGYLLAWGNQGTFLQKRDLQGGEQELFRQAVSERMAAR